MPGIRGSQLAPFISHWLKKRHVKDLKQYFWNSFHLTKDIDNNDKQNPKLGPEQFVGKIVDDHSRLAPMLQMDSIRQ